MSIKQKIKSKILVFIVSYMMLFQSLSSLTVIDVKAVEGTSEYSVYIHEYIQNQIGNKVPIIATITENIAGLSTALNTEFSISLYKGTDLIRKVSQGEDDFRISEDQNQSTITILAYFNVITTGEYKIVVESRNDGGEWVEIGSKILNITQREPNIKSAYLNVDSNSFNVSVNNFGGNLFKGLASSDVSVELWDKDNNVVACSSSIIDGDKAVDLRIREFTIEPFNDLFYYINFDANLYKVSKIEPGVYKVIIKAKGQIVTKDETIIEAVDKIYIDLFQYETNIKKLIAPGVRGFNVNLGFLGDTNKSLIGVELQDLQGNIIAKSISSDYKWVNQDTEDALIAYCMEVLEGKNIEANKYYKFKIVGNNILLDTEDYSLSEFQTSDFIRAINCDYSRIKSGIFKAKLANFHTDKEYKAELYNIEGVSGSWFHSPQIGTSLAKPSLDGSIEFMFKDSNGNLINSPNNNFGIILSFPTQFAGQYQEFYVNTFSVPNHIIDDAKEIYENLTKAININTKSFNTKLIVKNIVPNNTSTYIKLLDINGQEVGTMYKNSIKISYLGNTDRQAPLYEISGVINITGSLTLNNQYSYSIQCGSDTVANTAQYTIVATDKPSANGIDIIQAVKLGNRFLPSSINELDTNILGTINVPDINNLDVQLVNTIDGKNYVTLDKSLIQIKNLDEFAKNISLKLKVNEKLIDGDYDLIVKYNGVEFKRDRFLVSTSSMYRSYYFSSILSTGDNRLSLTYYDALNIDPSKMQVSLTDIYGNNIPLTIVQETIKFDNKNLSFDAVPAGALDIGSYIVNVSQDTEDLTKVEANQLKNNIIMVTEKAIINNVAYEKTSDNKTSYVIKSNEFNTSSSYKAIFYKNNEDMHLRTSVKELPILVTENGKLVIAEEQLQDLEQGDYNVFVEKDNTILGSVFLSYSVNNSEEGILDLKEVNVDSFDLGTTSKVTISATNYTLQNKDVTLITVLYDKNTNKMIKYSSDYKTLASGDSVNLEASIDVPEQGEFKVKYFIWDTLKNMNPYIEAKTVK